MELRSELNPENGVVLGLLGTEDMADEVSLSRNHLFRKMLKMSKTERSMTEPLEGLP